MTTARRFGRVPVLATAAALALAGIGTPTMPSVAAQDACPSEVEPNDRPEQAPALAGEVCLTGSLVEQPDQDLFLWEVAPEDGLTTWAFTVRGVPTTITSAHVFRLPDPVVYPIVDVPEVFRADSDAHLGTPPVTTEARLAPGTYLVGISRGDAGFNQALTDDREYELRIARTGAIPPTGDVEPNDDPTSATPVSGGFALSGDLAGSNDVFRWTLSPEEASRPWRLEAVTSMGAALHVALATAAAEHLVGANDLPDGTLAIHDLRLPAGDYLVTVLGPMEGAQPYVLRAVEVTDPDIDPEPNDSTAHAVPLDPTTLAARGRLAFDGDVDRYLLDVDAALASVHLDISLSWSDGSYRSFCVSTEAATTIGCPGGEGSAALEALVLPVGRYLIDVAGTPSLDDRYELRIVPGAAAAADQEAEPNDLPDTATPWDPTVIMHGTAAGTDVDTYRIHIDGPPLLWRLDVAGTGISSLAWLRPDLTPLGSAAYASDGSRASIDDLYLIPGDHVLSIQANGGYELALTEQGEPVAGSELEPNDDSGHAEPIRIGAARTGRLPTTGDWDLYRFTLTAPTHVVLRFQAPPDSAVELGLWIGLEPVIGRSARPGELVEEDLALPPADYELQLHSIQPSRETYSLTLEWADPFALADDQEPNDSIHEARPLPATLEADGTARSVPDEDWYQLPLLGTPGSLRIRAEGEQVSISLTDGGQSFDLQRQGDQVTYIADGLPTDVPLYLDVTASAPYRLSVSGSGLDPQREPTSPRIDLELVTRTDAVAAFRRESQHVSGTLSIASTAATDLDLTLDGTTSGWGWVVRPEPSQVRVPAGATVAVPVTLDVPRDAWSREPVRVTVRARDATGGQRTTSIDLMVDPEVEPVEPGSEWTIPDAMLGGLDVAAAVLGAVPGGTVDPVQEQALYDGVTADGVGFAIGNGILPVDLDVDLAGDQPIPVAGTIVHPEGVVSSLSPYPREFDLLLSADGTDWQVALSGELAPLPVDQAFALPEPVDARFARLRIRSKYGLTSNVLSLAEWKVVAVPGTTPTSEALDIADPALGGHIVWMDPWFADRWGVLARILDADRTRETTGDTGRGELTMLLAFQDDRAAQVTELGWVDPDGSDPAARLETVAVEVSLDSPLGPWRSVGTWALHRAEDGSVAPYPLPPGTWARYVKLTALIPPSAVEIDTLELPGTVRVMERISDQEYRSVLGEWGDASPSGPYEWLVPPADAGPVGSDAGDTTETATTLPSATAVRDRVQFEVDEDWFALTVPDGQDTLSISIAAQPTQAVEPTLRDAAGVEVPLTQVPRDAGTASWIAVVRPGETYRLRVGQPVFSSVVTFDTSGSLAFWVPRIMSALRTFAAGVQRGREAVMIMPFEEEPLLKEWSDDPDALRRAVDGFTGGGSSAAVTAMLDAAALLGDRTGIHAIFVIHDAEDVSSYLTPQLWQAFGRVRPVVFSVLVSNLGPAVARDVFQDWAAPDGGFYQYATTQGDMDKALARMAAWLRRPADYSLAWTAADVEHPPPEPGGLSVVPRTDPGGDPGRIPIAGGTAVEIILDTSGSMLDKVGKKRRIDIAKAVLTDLVTEGLPAGTPLALRVFGDARDVCGTRLAVPLGPLDPARVVGLVRGVRVVRAADTPIGAAIGAVAGDLADDAGTRIVLLITDAEEVWPHPDLCGRDPAEAIEALRAAGVEVRLDIVGFGLTGRRAKAQLRRWAELGGGEYVDAADQRQLAARITQALRAPFRVLDASGTVVATGTVGGEAVSLPPGSYRVEVLTEPPIVFQDVVIESAGSVRLTLP
jgi:hypothetical protein